jgi:hypothetical protein
MTELSVGRLSVTARTDARTPDAERIDRLLHAVAHDRLEQAVRTAGLPPGIWCLRRLDVPVALDPGRPDSSLATAWAAALVAALRAALNGGSPDVVCYPDEHEAVLDLVCATAVGRTERLWAWRRTGLIRDGDPAPDRAPGAAVLAVLQRSTALAPALIAAAAERVGLSALHRTLGTAGWRTLAEAVRSVLGGPRWSGGPVTVSAPMASLARTLLTDSPLAGQIRRSGLRPTAVTVEGWALLAVAAADPSALRRPAAGEVVAAATEFLAGTAHGRARADDTAEAPPTVRGAGPVGGESERERTAGTDSLPTAGFPPPRPPSPGLPSLPMTNSRPTPNTRGQTISATDDGHPTPWAGLLFLLATAEATGIPEAVLDDEVFAARPLPWVLQGIALSLLATDAADPAVAAFAGSDPALRPPWERGPAATAAELLRIAELADAWARPTAALLDTDDDRPARETVAALARRRGHIRFRPGWTEARLAAAEVDVTVRRAGLDLDPGWIPWLGTVVRFVYE